jgi:hypothetical protein
VGLGNVWQCKLRGVLEQRLGASIGSESKRREKLGEEVVMAARRLWCARGERPTGLL